MFSKKFSKQLLLIFSLTLAATSILTLFFGVWAIPIALLFGLLMAFFLSRSLSSITLSTTQRAEQIARDHWEKDIKKLSQDKAELFLILSTMIEAVVAVDAQKKVLAINPAFSRLFDVKAEEALGRPFYEIMRQASLTEILQWTLRECKARSQEAHLFTPEERTFEANALPLMENGKARGALLVLHDITRTRKLEEMRRDFVANVSHELRTPITSIKGSAESLLDGALKEPKEALEFTQAIKEDADRLARLVDELLELSTIESEKKEPKFEPVSLLQLASVAAEKLKAFAAKNNVAIKVAQSNGLPAVRADKKQMGQVFINLIDNAIKFNKENGVVNIAVTTDGQRVITSIQDTGIGIPAEDIKRIFERFYRVDKARSRELGGTGLGLAIVKHIVEAHGGAVTVESAEDKGTTFQFSLPIAA